MDTHDSARAAAPVALGLAAEQPDRSFPCPWCGADVGASNLAKHFRKVHEWGDANVGDATLVVVDRRMVLLAIVPVVLVVLGFWPFVVELAGGELDRFLLLVWMGAFCLVSLPLIAALNDKFKAQLEVGPDSVRLRYALGMAWTAATFPLRFETGSLIKREEQGMAKDGHGYYGPSEDVHAGSYIRCTGANGTSLILGSKSGTQLRKYWRDDEIAATKNRRRRDVDLTAVQMIQIQYHLAARGQLSPRP